MKRKQVTALCSTLGLMLSGAAYADSAVKVGDQKSTVSPFEQGMPIKDDQVMSGNRDGRMVVPAGINQSGRINPDSSNDFFVTASFIYWMASTDGLNYDRVPFDYTSSGGLVASDNCGEVFIKPHYKPGFKVGLGYNSNFDDWTVCLEYTWLHQTNHMHHSANDCCDTSGNVFLLSPAPYNIAGDLLSAHWKLDLDVLDFAFSRAYYVGQRLIVEPFAGLRAAWIRQHLHLDLSSTAGSSWVTNQAVASDFEGHGTCHSWGLGARLGFNSKWLLGYGFRVDAKAAGSLLFTRYSHLSEESSSTSGGTTYVNQVNAASNSLHYHGHYDVMRANSEMGLGFGWGTYFGADDGYHFDIAAIYDFSIWWSQNMLRGLFDAIRLKSSNDPTDLMYHGPTVTLRLDF